MKKASKHPVEAATSVSGKREAASLLAQSVGVDVSKDKLACCFMIQRQLNGKRELKVRSSKQFTNSPAGIRELKTWIGKWRDEDASEGASEEASLAVTVVMEATGVYHNQLAYGLNDVSAKESLKVCIVLPNRAKHYANSLSTKTKTDHTDAQMLAQMGVERDLDVWQAPGMTMRKIKVLCRERGALSDDSTAVKNRQHALEYGGIADNAALKRHKEHIAFLDKQMLAVEKEIKSLVATDAALKADIERLCTIPGVGWITAITVLAETDSFALIRNKNQLTSYAGLDIVERQSGTSLRGKTHISKKGNSHLRAALYFPAVSHITCNGCFTPLFERLTERGAQGLKAYVAVQRKLLILMCSLHKNKTPYNPNHGQIVNTTAQEMPETTSTETITETITETTTEITVESHVGTTPEVPERKKENSHTLPKKEKKSTQSRHTTTNLNELQQQIVTPKTPHKKTGKRDLVEPACTA